MFARLLISVGILASMSACIIVKETGPTEETGPRTTPPTETEDDDLDDDGYGADDCDDSNAAINPGAVEACDDLDNDCDKQIDEDDQVPWYMDADGDGYGDAATEVMDCASPGSGYIDASGDCDDTNGDINGGGTEVCNGADDDCDGETDEPDAADAGYVDADGDGQGDPAMRMCGGVKNDTDCNDADPTVYTGAAELCDGMQNDCAAKGWKSDDGRVTWFGASGTVDVTEDYAAGVDGSPAFVELAEPGTLRFCDGVYYAMTTALGDGTIVESLNGAETTWLSGGSVEQVLLLNAAGGTFDVSGVTITEGYACFGAAISNYQQDRCLHNDGDMATIAEGVTVSLHDAVIMGNEDDFSAVRIGGMSTLDMVDVEVYDNVGSGVYLDQSWGTCTGDKKTSAGSWLNTNWGVQLVTEGDLYTYASASCDYGTDALKTDNGRSDIQLTNPQGNRSSVYGDDATFVCTVDATTRTCG